MEVQPVEVDNVGSFPKSFLHIAILEHAVPDSVGAGRLVQDALVFQRLFGIDDWIERFVFDLN